jgi:hypothetical protein
MLDHKIFPTKTGYFLEILEPAVVEGNRVRPFIFKAGVNSALEALEILNLIQGTKAVLPRAGGSY